MKIQVLTDLHLEFGEFTVPATTADVMVFAGDIAPGTDGLDWILEQSFDIPVIYVPGNHEYYHHDLDLIDTLRERAAERVHVLDMHAVIIQGVRFLGCTLWTDFCLFGEAERWFAIQHAQRNMADFAIIAKDGKRFTPMDSIDIHQAQRRWLAQELARPFAGRTVIVTHHFPSPGSIHPRFARDPLTPAFGSDLESLMDGDKVPLWIHGHTHDAFDYEVNGTRVVCNPRGYTGYERGEDFRGDLVVEIE